MIWRWQYEEVMRKTEVQWMKRCTPSTCLWGNWILSRLIHRIALYFQVLIVNVALVIFLKNKDRLLKVELTRWFVQILIRRLLLFFLSNLTYRLILYRFQITFWMAELNTNFALLLEIRVSSTKATSKNLCKFI